MLAALDAIAELEVRVQQIVQIAGRRGLLRRPRRQAELQLDELVAGGDLRGEIGISCSRRSKRRSVESIC